MNAYYEFAVDVAKMLGANEARARKDLKDVVELEIKLAKVSNDS